MTATSELSHLQGEPIHDLNELARRFPDGFIERKDGIDYVAHHVVTQRLLSIVGPFDFELVEIIRGDVAAAAPDPGGRSRRARAGTPPLHHVVVGGVWRLTCQVDGRRVRIEEVGDVGDVHNWTHDGARLKDAASDALKRCAMRLGLGLHLWAQEHYFLDRQLRAILEVPDGTAEAEEAAAQRPRPQALGPGDPEQGATPPPGGRAPATAPPAAASPRGKARAAAPPAGPPPAAEAQVAAAPATPPPAAEAPAGAAAADDAERRPRRGRRRPAAGGGGAQGARAMPVRGMAEWEPPDEGLVERFDALVEAAGVSAANSREFLRRSPHYSGVSEPGELHGPALARLVERMGQETAAGAPGLAAFRAKVEEVLAVKSG